MLMLMMLTLPQPPKMDRLVLMPFDPVPNARNRWRRCCCCCCCCCWGRADVFGAAAALFLSSSSLGAAHTNAVHARANRPRALCIAIVWWYFVIAKKICNWGGGVGQMRQGGGDAEEEKTQAVGRVLAFFFVILLLLLLELFIWNKKTQSMRRGTGAAGCRLL